MKAKKALSFILIFAMVLSMMASLGVTANAATANYTVDFTYNGVTKKVAGDSKNYDLAKVFAALGINEEIKDVKVCGFENNIVKNNNKEVIFDIVKNGDDWQLNSYKAFDENFTMIVSTALNSYSITVSDPTAAAKLLFGTSQNGSYETKLLSSGQEVTPGSWAIYNYTYIVNTTPNSGYEVDSVLFGTAAATKVSENKYSYTFEEMPASDVTVNVTFKTTQPTNSCDLDLDSSTTAIKDNKELDQNYKLSVKTGTATDVSKVKLTWTINDINATRTDDKVWDTTELCWKTSSSSTTVQDNGTAEFKFENYSSEKVNAAVKFKASSTDFNPTVSFDETTGEDGTITLDTANGNDTYSKTNVPSGTISVTVKPGADDFKKLSATTSASKYGTYTVTISKAAEMATLTFVNSTSNATLSYKGTVYNYGESFSFDVPKNSTVAISSASMTQSTLTVDGKSITQTANDGYMASWTITNNAVITESMTINSSNCILSGTPVTLADGSTKLIDDVTTEDKLMTFNFYEGKLDGNYPMYVMKHEDTISNVITVTLDNGTVLEMCDWQQFFDMDEKTYFDITATNYQDSIGKNIMFVANSAATTAKITNATMKPRKCTSYEIFTEYNKNFIANGILTVEPETYLQGVYTIGDDLKIDMAQYQKDVKTYGKYTYQEFADIMTKAEFDKMNIADKKIAVGKGMVSEEWLFALYKTWTPMYQ